VTDAVVRDFHPQRIILFGSRAYGTPRPDSDVDLMVVLPFEAAPITMMPRLLATAYQAMKKQKRQFAVEMHPRRPLAPGAQPDDVMRDALEKGIVLYEAAA